VLRDLFIDKVLTFFGEVFFRKTVVSVLRCRFASNLPDIV
jgi:hypothetical protein